MCPGGYLARAQTLETNELGEPPRERKRPSLEATISMPSALRDMDKHLRWTRGIDKEYVAVR
jgi:hypothetical protein